MPRQNKSRYAVLGFLSWRPASGYDIRQAISHSVGNFWNESYGQIYPALRELEREGLAQRSVERTPGKPDRHVYTITEAGRDDLRRWLEQPCEPHVYRVEVLIKLFFGENIPLESCLAHVARYRAEHQALLAQYEAVGEHLSHDLADDPRLPFWMLTVDCGRGAARAYIDWCDRAEQALQALAAPAAPQEKTKRTRAKRPQEGRGGARAQRASGGRP